MQVLMFYCFSCSLLISASLWRLLESLDLDLFSNLSAWGRYWISAWRKWIPCNLEQMFFFKENLFQWQSSSLDEISTLWVSHYTQDPLNNDNIQLTYLGVVPSIHTLWENGHNTNSRNFIFKYLIISIKQLWIFEICCH